MKKAVLVAEAPRGARELARGLEERLEMTATQYLKRSEPTPRPAPWPGPAAASPEAMPAGGRSVGSGEVAAAIIAALLSGLLATGLGWIAAGLV